jgi:hypothetical protein
MQFIQGSSRNQTYFITLEDQVAADNSVRLMDAFIDKLDMQKLRFNKAVCKSEGRQPLCACSAIKVVFIWLSQ